MLHEMLKEQILLEISLKDHYEKYIRSKYNLDFDTYITVAKLDPTTINDQRGKYVEWIIKNFIDENGEWKIDITNMNNVKTALAIFIKKPVDINSIKSFEQLEDYVETIPEMSGKEKKRKEKNLHDFPNDIKIIDETDDWICIQTLTREGNIKGAQFGTSPQAKWCTAYLNDDYHWKQYSRNGDLLQFINKRDPYEKYQIYITDGEITESRDYNDRSDNKPHSLIKNEFSDFTTNYGRVKERPPFKFVWDEEGAAYNLLSNNGVDNDMEYLNREPDEDEYNDYYEEAISNEEFQIYHWDRFIKTGLEIYKNESKDKYFDESRMEYFPSYFYNPVTGDETDKEPAKEAVMEMYNRVEEMWNEFIEDEVVPDKRDDESNKAYDIRKSYWINNKFEEFKKDNVIVKYMEYFKEYFPYEYSLDTGIDSWTKDNSDEQMSFNFESIRKMLAMK